MYDIYLHHHHIHPLDTVLLQTSLTLFVMSHLADDASALLSIIAVISGSVDAMMLQ